MVRVGSDVVETGGHHGRVCHPGRDHVDSDAFIGELGAKAAKEAEDAGFGCAIDVDRGCVDEARGHMRLEADCARRMAKCKDIWTAKTARSAIKDENP